MEPCLTCRGSERCSLADHMTLSCLDPAEALQLPMDYVQRVKRTHSQGGYGSQG